MSPSLRDWKPAIPQCSPKLDVYQAFKDEHRPHQLEAIEKCAKDNKGQVISPCGTGKTRIQISLHVETMLAKNDEGAVCVIASHRLSLNRQLRDELVKVLIECGISFDLLSIGSDRSDTDKYYRSVEEGGYSNLGYSPKTSRHLTTLSGKECEEFIARARQDKRHVLVVSTYNSIDRLANVGTIDILTHDEAHNTVRQDFNINIQKVKGNALREYYFTATRKIKKSYNNGGDIIRGGMDDNDFYGAELFNFKPHDALDCGEIATPHIHMIQGSLHETIDTNDTGVVVKSVMEAFDMHKQRIKNDSISPEEVGAKIIVGCIGIQEMMNVYNELKKRDYNIPCFAISSNGCWVNWETAKYTEFFDKLRQLKDSEDALIFNVDMLTEGIDLPSITGVMPLRNLGVIKLIQLLGRALRLTKDDRKRIYAGELLPGDHKNYIKPLGHLIISEHLRSVSDYEEMKSIVKNVYEEYGVPIEEMITVERFEDGQHKDLPPMVRPDPPNGNCELEHIFLTVGESSIEDLLKKERGLISYDYKNKKSIYSRSPQQRIDYMLGLLEEYNDINDITVAN
jgi:predicted helicase